MVRREVPVLETSDLDLAVAFGAAYYGQVRQGKGVRIRGGAARSYYIGIESSAPAVPGVARPIKAVCVVPMGMEEGTEADVPGQEFGLVVGEPADSGSWARPSAAKIARARCSRRWSGDELEELAPLETALEATDLRAGEAVPVRLHSRVTEVGTLELSCQSTRDPTRWKLEYSMHNSAAE